MVLSVPPDVFALLEPLIYLLRHIENGIRPSGAQLGNIKNTFGSALVGAVGAGHSTLLLKIQLAVSMCMRQNQGCMVENTHTARLSPFVAAASPRHPSTTLCAKSRPRSSLRTALATVKLQPRIIYIETTQTANFSCPYYSNNVYFSACSTCTGVIYASSDAAHHQILKNSHPSLVPHR